MGVSGLAGDPAYPPRQGAATSTLADRQDRDEGCSGHEQARLALVARTKRNSFSSLWWAQPVRPPRHVSDWLCGWGQGFNRSHPLAPGAGKWRPVDYRRPCARNHCKRRRLGDRRDLSRPQRARAAAGGGGGDRLCNGVGTPRLLLLSKSAKFPDGLANSSGLVGKNLMMHPYAAVTGISTNRWKVGSGPPDRPFSRCNSTRPMQNAASCAARSGR